MSYHKYLHCIEHCLKCAAMCNHNVYALLQEEDVNKYKKCIQLSSECAAMCYAAVQMMSLGSSHAREIWGICSEICMACAIECEKHSESSHCRETAQTCRICDECMSL
jgi:hypothetical protein